MKYAIYARVSTNRNRCRNCRKFFPSPKDNSLVCSKCGSSDIEPGQNPESQLMPLRAYVTNRGDEIHAEYVDHGFSGSKDTRPALDALMADARRGVFKVVVVARFDRFARSVPHLIRALDEFRSLGIGFVSINEAIDTTTPMGRMVFTIIAAVAELERELIRERVLAGMDRARKQGKEFGRPEVIADKELIRRLSSEGASLRVIAKATGISHTKVSQILALKS